MENYGILLVEDEPAYNAIISALLAARGIAVDWAGNGRIGVEAVAEHAYDLILMDIEMPEMDGFAATAAIRARGGPFATVPIIAFTSLAPPEGERHFLDRGFDGWLAKPFTASAFNDAIAARLGPPAAVQDEHGAEDRLGRLLGVEGARAMIERFHASLEEAIEAIDGGADSRAHGHRIGGLAGTLGFAPLSAAWLALQQDAAAWPTVRKLTREALDLDRPGPHPSEM